MSRSWGGWRLRPIIQFQLSLFLVCRLRGCLVVMIMTMMIIVMRQQDSDDDFKERFCYTFACLLSRHDICQVSLFLMSSLFPSSSSQSSLWCHCEINIRSPPGFNGDFFLISIQIRMKGVEVERIMLIVISRNVCQFCLCKEIQNL